MTSESDVIDSDFAKNDANAEAEVAARLFDDDNFPKSEINSCRTWSFIEFKLKLKFVFKNNFQIDAAWIKLSTNQIDAV